MLLNIYLKEMKDCFRDSRTLFLTVLLPIIMMTGLTIFYEKILGSGEGEVYSLAIKQSADEARMFDGMKNIKLVETDQPEEAVKNGDAQAALIFGSDFKAKISAGEKADVTLMGDNFSQKSSSLMTLVTNQLNLYEKSIVSERLKEKGTDPSVTEPFTISQKGVSNEDTSTSMLAMLIPLILSIAIGIGASPAALDLFAGEKEKKTMEALLMTPVKRGPLVLAKWLTISSIGTITGLITLIVVALEITFLTENLKKAVSFGDHTLLIVLLGILIAIVYSMFNASLLMLASIAGKSIKEAQSYSTPVMMVSVFPVMFISTMGINELSTVHFAIPIMNIFCMMKELIFGIISWEHILVGFGTNILCMGILFAAGRVMFKKDKWVMN
ncbi:ABC transporter permease [Metabacillus sp. GX 13764]|uniref:ABC transporter permease n=1 Tax=Metabacillus kandeliae TaxID=2900151 RepID=UPI001E500E57|nr:ABC transporter permease [Metabacillus kandeliae]MCD7034209.1 ABC transporter permease [Metabacillus kandeliae]